jgi:hypothetical protein
MNNDKPRRSILSGLTQRNSEPQKSDNEKEPLELKPAMPELGTAPCPVCGHRVAVFVTRTKAAIHQLRLLLSPHLLQRLAFDGTTEGSDQGSEERRVPQMSGAGLVSVRLPRSLIAALEAHAAQVGMDVHGTARQLVSSLGGLSDAELASLPDPPKESDNPRLSLYVGWSNIEALTAASHRTQLSTSSIVRRLVYRRLVTGSVSLGESGESRGFSSPRVLGCAGELSSASLTWAAAVVLGVAVVGAVFFYLWLRRRRQRTNIGPPNQSPSRSTTRKEADPQ